MPSPNRKRVTWIEVTPEIIKKYLSPLSYPEYEKIGESIGYSAEYIRQIFVDGRERLNKVVFDGIVKWVQENGKAKSSPAKKNTVSPQSKKQSNGTNYLAQRRELKNKVK